MLSKIGTDSYQFTDTVVEGPKQVEGDLRMDGLLKDSLETGRFLLQFGLRSTLAMFSLLPFSKLPCWC